MQHDESLGLWIKERRYALDLTQEALAEQVGCAPITIRRIENESLRPSRVMAARLAHVLQLPPEEQVRFVALARGLIDPPTAAAVSQTAMPAQPAAMAPHQPPQATLFVPPPPRPHHPPQVTNFVGRESELEELTRQLAATRLAVITGLAGVGKTTLAAMLARRVRDPGSLFWHAFHQGEDVAVLIWELAAFLAHHGQSSLWQLLHRPVEPGGQPLPPELLVDYLIPLLGEYSYLLCFDDFHLVDDDAILKQFLSRLLSQPPTEGSAVIITARRVPPLALPASHTPLGGLSRRAMRTLLRKHGLQLSEPLAAELYAATEGNAQFLLFSINLLRRGGDLAALITRLTETEDLERYLLREVDSGLTDQERQVLGALAALLGYPGTSDVLEALLECHGLHRLLSALRDRQLVTITQTETSRLYSLHAIIQSFYYRQLSRHERQELHRRAGAYYEREEPNLFKAAQHFQRAGEHGHAAGLATRDIWALINQGQARALSQLLDSFKREQLALLPWIAVNLARGEIATLLGQNGLARSSYEEALAQLTTLPDSPEVRERLAAACRGIGEALEYDAPQEALSWLQRGLETLAGTNVLEQARLQIKRGSVLIALADYVAARSALETTLQLLPANAYDLRASAYVNLGIIHCIQGHLTEGEQALLQALPLFQQTHNDWGLVNVQQNLGSIKDITGDWVGAAHEYQGALALAQRLGRITSQVGLMLNLAILHTRQGQLAAALAYLRDCLELAREHQLKEYLVGSLASLADLHIRLGEPGVAESALAEAEQLALELGNQQSLAEIYRCLAETALQRGNWSLALAEAERSLALALELELALEEGISQRLLAQAYMDGGQQARGQAAFERSLTLLLDSDPYEAARTRARWGQALFTLGETEQSLPLLQQARQTFQELGAQRDLAACDELLAHAQGRVQPSSPRPDR